MSLIGAGTFLGRVLPAVGTAIGGYFGGVGGAAIGAQIGSAAVRQPSVSAQPIMAASAALPALPAIGGMISRVLPGAGRIAGVAAGVALRGARTAIRSATYYCKRYPAWCVAFGGLGSVADAVSSGTLPPHRGGRRRGITAGEFRAFRRVHNTLSKFCAPRVRIRRGKR